MKHNSTRAEDTNMQMGFVSLIVANLERSLPFYEQILGCTLLAQNGNRVVLGGASPLLLLTERRDALPRSEHATGLYHLALLLPSRVDLACAVHHLLENAYPLQGNADHGVSEVIYLADPDGNGIELYRDRPRSAWPWTNGLLEANELSTFLNIENLLMELEGTTYSWRGLPETTRIGHVHLSVADLAQSKTFYSGILGLEESITGISGACFFAANGYHHHVGCNIWTSPSASVSHPDTLGLHFFTLVLVEQAEVLKRVSLARAAGIPVVQHKQSYLLHDPVNNGVLLTTEPLQQGQEVIELGVVFQ